MQKCCGLVRQGHTWAGVVDMDSGPIGPWSCSCLLGAMSCAHTTSDAPMQVLQALSLGMGHSWYSIERGFWQMDADVRV